MQPWGGYVQGEAGTPEARVPEQQLDAAQVDPGFQQMRRKGVPQEMRINGLGEIGGVAGFLRL
jgi:hypothetical protein